MTLSQMLGHRTEVRLGLVEDAAGERHHKPSFLPLVSTPQGRVEVVWSKNPTAAPSHLSQVNCPAESLSPCHVELPLQTVFKFFHKTVFDEASYQKTHNNQDPLKQLTETWRMNGSPVPQ